MKPIFLVALLLSTAAAAKVRLVATVSDLGAIAREVGQDRINVELLARPSEDPHFVDARPNLVLALSRADLLLVMGMDLEIGWLPVLQTGSRNSKIQRGGSGYLDCSTLITPLEVPVEKLDRSMGDIHAGGNPHYTRDPRNAVFLARGIAEKLAAIDPANAAQYREAAEAFAKNLSSQIAQWQKALAPLKGTPVVPYHKSWIYFVDFAGLTEVAFVEPKPGLPPSTGHVARVLQIIRERKVPFILQEEWYPASTSELLARSGPTKLLRVPGMTPEGKRYAEYMGDLVAAVVKASAH